MAWQPKKAGPKDIRELFNWAYKQLTSAGESVPEVVAAPTTATDAGEPGQVAYDSSYFYVCTASNTWVRATLSTW